MIEIVCPSCQARYQLPPGSIGPGGRNVSCASCSHKWRASPASAEPEESSPASSGESAPVFAAVSASASMPEAELESPPPETAPELPPETIPESPPESPSLASASADAAAIAAPVENVTSEMEPSPAAGDHEDQEGSSHGFGLRLADWHPHRAGGLTPNTSTEPPRESRLSSLAWSRGPIPYLPGPAAMGGVSPGGEAAPCPPSGPFRHHSYLAGEGQPRPFNSHSPGQRVTF